MDRSRPHIRRRSYQHRNVSDRSRHTGTVFNRGVIHGSTCSTCSCSSKRGSHKRYVVQGGTTQRQRVGIGIEFSAVGGIVQATPHRLSRESENYYSTGSPSSIARSDRIRCQKRSRAFQQLQTQPIRDIDVFQTGTQIANTPVET